MKLRNLFLMLFLCMGIVALTVSCTGEDGEMGLQGEQGATGDAGPQGDTGDAGPQGDKGDTGDAGPQGDKGEDGEDLTVEEPPNPNECNLFATGPNFTGSTGDDTICGTDADNTIDGGEGDDTIFGLAGGDTLIGGEDRDTLHGGAGDDTLDGGEDRDTLNGGAGNDILKGGEGDDVLNGGEGSDTVDYSENADAEGDPITDPIIVTIGSAEIEDDGFGDEDTLISIENVTGGPGPDALTGNDEDNVLTGGPGDDTINGGKGDDTIDGGIEQTADAPGPGEPFGLDGGEGSDTLIINGTTATLTEMGGVNENSRGFENLTGGDGDDMLIGNSKDNVLDGRGNTANGMNTLRGDATDATAEMKGEDTFIVWIRDGGRDDIADFQIPAAGVEGVLDVVRVKSLDGDTSGATAEDSGTEGQIVIKTATTTQTINLAPAPDDDTIDAIVGSDGRGSSYLIFD